MGAQSGINPYDAGQPYTDTGTGAVEGPPESVTYGAEHDPEPTGAHPGPPAEVTVESPPDHLAGPTGAHPGPPLSVTHVQHPATAKAVKGTTVEDKAVRSASKKGAS